MSRVLKFEKPGGKAAAPVASKLENGTRRWRREDGGGSDYMRGLGEKRSRSIKQVLTGGRARKRIIKIIIIMKEKEVIRNAGCGGAN